MPAARGNKKRNMPVKILGLDITLLGFKTNRAYTKTDDQLNKVQRQSIRFSLICNWKAYILLPLQMQQYEPLRPGRLPHL